MAICSFFSCLFLLLIFLLTEAINGGFTVDLIQRDSPFSPFYHPSLTQFDRLHGAFRRSVSRIHHFHDHHHKFSLASSTLSTVQSTITVGEGEYLMNISVGTPPVEVLGIADTGSDLIWTQCKPCTQCFMQNPPLFDPKRSSTYRSIPCESNFCTRLEEATCGSVHDACEYSYSYGDRSFTKGNLASDTLTLGTSSTSGSPPVSIPRIVFGCGHENGGTFDESGSGLIGLGGGSLSLVSQLGKSTINGGKKIFSYCLVSLSDESNHTSKISFGRSSSTIFGRHGAVSTTLVAKEPSTFYFLTLEAISVGENRLVYKTSPSKIAAEKGNIIIDSGTTLTILPPGFHDDLVSALEEAVNAERVSDPRGVLSLCFRGSESDIQVPTITAHFSGADVVLQPFNTFAKVEDGMFCFTMIPSEDVAIFGNLAQMNLFVEYDLDKRTVSFMPVDCTKHYQERS